MIHAFLITAYRDEVALEGLIHQILKIDRARIYINIDNRSSDLISKTESLIKKIDGNRIYMQSERKIHWGGFGHLNVFMEMLRIALNDQCEYFHTLTGQCRLTQSTVNFIEFFDKNKHLSFVENFQLPTRSWPGNGGLNRVKYYQLYDLLDAKKPGKFFKRLNKHFIHLQKLLFINRLKNYTYHGGSGYFSINRAAASYLDKEFESRQKEFKNTFCPEEIAPQTILLNSPDQISKNITNNNLRYVLWETKNGEVPGILDENDLDKIKDNRYFFARKFDSAISNSLIEVLKIGY